MAYRGKAMMVKGEILLSEAQRTEALRLLVQTVCNQDLIAPVRRDDFYLWKDSRDSLKKVINMIVGHTEYERVL